jgi:hypothetical protein
MSDGDYIGLEQGGKYSLHRLTADATTNVGGVFTMSVVPLIPPGLFTSAGILRIQQPVCQMIIAPDDLPSVSRSPGPQSLSFSAVQAVI